MIRFYLDGQEVDNPKGWEGMRSVIKRDQETNGITIFQDQDVEFTGDGYAYIESVSNLKGYCAIIDCEVTRTVNGATKRLLRGHIFISDCQFNERTCSVVAKVKDSSYSSMIEYNKGIEAVVSAGKSKNNSDIDPCPKFTLQMYDQFNNSVRSIYSVRVWDAFKYLVDFMSDGLIGFASDTFEYGSEWGTLVITSGFKIRSTSSTIYQNAPIPAFSFDTLYKEINKRIPIGFIIESPYDNPVLRVESLEYFSKSDNSSVVFSEVDEIKTRYDQNRIYSKLELGSSILASGTTFLAFPEDIKWFGFRDETFVIQTTCNIDNTLSLVGDWAVSSNVIENALSQNEESTDDTLFLIDTVLSSKYAGRTTNRNYLNLALTPTTQVYFHNERLTNKEVANRYLGLVPASIANYFKPEGTGDMRVGLSSSLFTSGVFEKVPFDSLSLDNGNNFDIVNNRYTAYTGGVYDFTTDIRAGDGYGCFFYVYLRVFDRDDNVLHELNYYNINNQPHTTRIALNEADYVEVWVKHYLVTGTPHTWSVNTNSSWTCEANTGTGGVFQDYDPADYPVQVHEFNYPMTQEQFEGIVSDPTNLFRFYSYPDRQRYGWISELNYTHSTGIASVKLITSKRTANGS